MGGFDPAWFIAVGIAFVLAATSHVITPEQRRPVGRFLINLAVVAALIGFGGLAWDRYHKVESPPPVVSGLQAPAPGGDQTSTEPYTGPSVGTNALRPGWTTVNIPANQGWTDTTFTVNTGETLAVSAAGSIIVTTDGHIPPMSPAGFRPNCTAAEVYGKFFLPFPAFQLPCWSLIGRIGMNGPIFEVGTNTTFRAQSSGEFYLGVNDNNLGDNSGNWTASIAPVR